MNVILLSISIVLLICYMIFLARRKDFDLLKTPPQTQTLPRSKYELAVKELNDFKKRPKPQSRKLEIEHNSEQFYLERRLYQVQQETDSEQKNYYLTCKEREITWQDYRSYFDSLSLLQKFVFPGKISELVVLRNLYLDTEKKVEFEINKFNARTRVRHHEEQSKKQREEEIERKTFHSSPQASNPTLDSTASDYQVEHDSIGRSESKDDLKYTNDSSVTDENSEPETTEKNKFRSIQNTNLKGNRHFGQEDYNDKYPDFTGLTYIDEHFSLAELNLSVVQDANFDKTYFVSVMFSGRHQYKNCSFQDTDFSYSKWQKSEIPHRILSCDFSRAKFNFSQLDFVAFYNCNFDFADFQEVQLRLVKFVNCRFQNCNISNVDFSKTVMSVDMLESVDFSSSISPPKNAANDTDPSNSAETPEQTYDSFQQDSKDNS